MCVAIGAFRPILSGNGFCLAAFHVIFSSGWEWMYWLSDVIVAEAAWDPKFLPPTLRLLPPAMCRIPAFLPSPAPVLLPLTPPHHHLHHPRPPTRIATVKANMGWKLASRKLSGPETFDTVHISERLSLRGSGF